MKSPDQKPEYHPGLAGVFLGPTRTSRVDGELGSLHIAGYPLEELAPQAEFEETVWLLWHDRLPTPAELETFRQELAARRMLPDVAVSVLRRAAQAGATPMAALAAAATTLPWRSDPEPSVLDSESLTLLARLPMAVACFERLRQGLEPVASPDSSASLAGSFLFHLKGSEPKPEEVRALNTYLNTVVDHGANASTFTARVIVSTGADLTSAVVGALGALSGPLHGGAPGPALEQVLEIGEVERAEEVLRAKLAAGERLMGFGHRVYKVRDPRAEVLSLAARRLYSSGATDPKLYDLAKAVEEVAVRLLDEVKPGRRLRTNVEYYTALLLHGLGFHTELFTSVFAMSRVAGWLAHAREQRAEGRLIRPRLDYRGPLDRRYPQAAEESASPAMG